MLLRLGTLMLLRMSSFPNNLNVLLSTKVHHCKTRFKIPFFSIAFVML